MKQITLFAVAVLLFCSSLTRAQNASDDMAMAVLSEKMDKLGAEMDDLGKIMETKGSDMEKYGKEMEKNNGGTADLEKQMSELGESMSRLGAQMGKLGEEMGRYGEKMGVLHQQMINWFFHELKNDALISSLNGQSRIIFDGKGLDVNGNKVSDVLTQKYKAGLEKYWGRTLKPDFLFFFNGTIQEKNGNVDAEGEMNTDL
ncbi:MAG TPA: hypothetical protein PLO67_05295 [Saprospiraceae bacterium]|nr:hypothetical protein [Saprospiraceae bacterium]